MQLLRRQGMAPVSSKGASGATLWDSLKVARYHARWLIKTGEIDESIKEFDNQHEQARYTHHRANNEAFKEEQYKQTLLPRGLFDQTLSLIEGMIRSKMLSIKSKLKSRFPGLDLAVFAEMEEWMEEALEEFKGVSVPAVSEKYIKAQERTMERTNP